MDGRVRPQHGLDPFDDRLQLRRIGSGYAQLHRIADRRTVLEAGNATADIRQVVREQVLDTRQHRFADGFATRHDDDLAEIDVRQLDIQRQVEARTAGTDVCGRRLDIGIVLQCLLDVADCAFGGGKAGRFGKPQIHDQFGPAGSREELLRHRLEKRKCGEKGGQGTAKDQGPMAQAPFEQPAKTDIEGAFGRRVVRGAGLRPLRQQLEAQVWREQDRDQPRHDQRDADHLEDRNRVLAGTRFGQANRHESRCRDQGTGQHRDGRRRVGVRGRPDPRIPLLELQGHHFDGDDGVIDEQPECDDQGAQRDSLQVDAERVHAQERDGEDQRNR